jgi:hypothetical protein
VHVIADTATEPESAVNVTRTAVHAIADTGTEPPSPVNVTRTAVHSLIDTDSEPPSPVHVTRVAVHVLFLSVYSLGTLNFSFRLRFRVGGCVSYDVRYRLRIRDAADTTNLLSVESKTGTSPALILEPPQVDGSTFDPLSGKLTTGAARVMVADAAAGTCLVPDDTNRAVTSKLADATGRQQLMGNKAYIEISRDGLSTPYEPYFAGYVTGLNLVDGITWEIALAHTSRDDETTLAWATNDYPHAVAKSALVGGPVTAIVPSNNVVAKQTFQGYWKATVQGIYDTFIHLDIDEDDCSGFPPKELRQYLDPPGNFFLGIIADNDNPFQRRVFRWAQGMAQPYFLMGFPNSAAETEWLANPTGKAAIRGYMPRLKVAFTEQDGSPIDFVKPMMASYTQKDGDTGRDSYTKCWENLGNHFYVNWEDAGADGIEVGDQLSFQILADDTSELSPLWLRDHPVDILADLLTFLGNTVNASSVTAAKAGMGDFVLAMRVTTPPTVAEAITKLCSVFGLGVRYEDDGTRSIFCWRRYVSPTSTITLNDLVDPASVWWRSEEQSILFSVEWQTQRFDIWPGQDQPQVSPSDRPADGVVPFSEMPIIFQTGVNQPRGTRAEAYAVPGMLLSSTERELTSIVDVCQAWSEQTFSLYRDGAITTEIEVFHELEDGTMPHVGDQVLLDLSARPGFDTSLTPVAQRGIPEHCLVIARTPTTTGYKLTLVKGPADIPTPVVGGVVPPSDGPYSIDFTLTKGAGALSSTTVVVTLDDPTGWTGWQFVVEYLVNPPFTPNDGTPGTLWYDPLLPTTPLSLGPFPAASTVWVRISAFGIGSFGPWQSLTLDAGESGSGGTIVQTPTIQLTMDGLGNVDATVNAGAEAVKVYAAADAVTFPGRVAILAGSSDTSPPYTFDDIITVNAGEIAYVGAIAEDAKGNTSIAAYAALQRAPAVEESIAVLFSGGISVNDIRDIQVPFACEVLGWAILGTVSGSIVVDIWRDTVANFPPTVGDTITGTGKPTVSSAASATGDTTGWGSTALVKDDILRFNVDSVTSFTQVTVSLTVRRT